MHAYIHTFIHTYIHTYIHSYIHTFIHTYIHTFIHTYIHTDRQTDGQTDIHTYIHHVTYVGPYFATPTAPRSLGRVCVSFMVGLVDGLVPITNLYEDIFPTKKIWSFFSLEYHYIYIYINNMFKWITSLSNGWGKQIFGDQRPGDDVISKNRRYDAITGWWWLEQ